MWNEISVLIGKELRCEWVINLEWPICIRWSCIDRSSDVEFDPKYILNQSEWRIHYPIRDFIAFTQKGQVVVAYPSSISLSLMPTISILELNRKQQNCLFHAVMKYI